MQNIPSLIRKLAKELPKFPDGRINYTNTSKAAVLTCFIEYQGKILLLKRSNKTGTYQGLWSTVTGYLDELKPLKNKVEEELEEELGLNLENINSFKMREVYEFLDKDINRTWIVYPVLVTLKNKPEIRLDREHIEFKWIKPENITKFKTPPKLEESLMRVVNNRIESF